MNVSSVSSYNPLSAIYGIQQVDSSDIASNLNSSDSIQSSGDKTKFSQMGQMMSELMQLQSTDPDKFKEVAQKISDDLAAQAASSSDSTQTSMLSEMSTKFATAAKTGSMDSLKPSGSHRGGKSGRASGSSGQDAMDTLTSTIASELSSLSNASTLASSNAGLSSMGGPEGMRYLMDQLKELQTSDPAKFKELSQKISDDLATQAQNSTDPGTTAMLTDMSSKFSSAAQSGSMDSLKPSTPPPPPPMADMGSSSSSSSDSGSSTSSSLLSADQQAQSLFARIQQLMANDLSYFTASTGTVSSS
ncbi:hypothetical protein [Fundidesulfovibrio terrae]|uniref:hypothetical protein n=1 Tax=Fundidesulfovibrio terrae TaxID=2922866 RepID=UPI001FAED833|nr:hypothetical protein [Fundidesulfovibrio terrae]